MKDELCAWLTKERTISRRNYSTLQCQLVDKEPCTMEARKPNGLKERFYEWLQ
jgi:hypothetical protein